jgi:hypothetical protein
MSAAPSKWPCVCSFTFSVIPSSVIPSLSVHAGTKIVGD